MGQQQLLILVLTIILVGTAVYLGLVAFDRKSREAQVDALVSHCMYVASEAVAWRWKETPFLGGGGSYEDLVGDEQAMERLIMAENRPPGTIKINALSGEELEIIAVSNDYPEIGVRVMVQGTRIGTAQIARDGSITLDGNGGG